MMKNKRQYYRDNSKYQPIFHRSGLALLPLGLFLLLLGFFGLDANFDVLSFDFHNLFMGLTAVATAIIVVGVGCLASYVLEPPIAQLELPKMTPKARKLSYRFTRVFTSSNLVEVLKLAPKTRWGYKLPNVECAIDDDLTSGYVLIENLGQFEKLERSALMESMSGVFQSRKIKDFEVVRADLISGGLFMRFDIEDLVNGTRLVIDNDDLSGLISEDKHDIVLGSNLVWHARKYPMMSIIARTGSGKSVLAGRYIAELARLQGWDVIYNSAKPDKYVIEFDGKSKPEDIVDLAERYVKIMRTRLAQTASAKKNDYADIGLNDVLLIFDELGILNAFLADSQKLKKRWENALKALAMSGRSAGIHLLLISQFGTVESFVNSSVRAQVSDVVIMLGNAASAASERQYVMGGYAELPTHYYGIGEGLALVSGAGRKWEQPHYYCAPWFKGFQGMVLGEPAPNFSEVRFYAVMTALPNAS